MLWKQRAYVTGDARPRLGGLAQQAGGRAAAFKIPSPYDLPRESRSLEAEFWGTDFFGTAPLKQAVRGLTLADSSVAAFASRMPFTSLGGAPIVGVIFIAAAVVNRGV